MRPLFLIPARGGSKGVPGKNIKLLNNKPLINYSIEVAQDLASNEDICISTDDANIIKVAESTGLKVPFVRPEELASDTAGSREVCLHAIDFYSQKGVLYDVIVLLQPTSPLRNSQQVKEAMALYNEELDMVVSVKETSSNPYYVLFEENEEGFLRKSKTGNFTSRHDCPKVWEYNGAIYVINVKALTNKSFQEFSKIRKYVMDDYSSVDIDNPLDWEWTEFLIHRNANR
ncbi:MAG: acylneuraminate cytidylyltransferase family protein [Chitinophaga sp.]|uniref:acylneuraminate cytidylyltransferase family protein n=1 Tax=Chitinophaga sp. TaxID=1869181 RepID=UPI001B045ADA|nr:acylneuraminate cytidylyltransferase family protein [Chitinophaga sp.]MBO9731727.1 acylneuraminate cytidylyltransferase family protein [Chitinophaga sp.]